MKRSGYFYTFLLLATVALMVYGFLIYFWIMAGLMVFSSVFSFVVFLIQTRVKAPVANAKNSEKPIDFYKAGTRTTYYQSDYQFEQLKQVNAE